MFSNEIPRENTRHNRKSQQRKKKAKIDATMSSDTAAASDDDAPSPLQKRIADCQDSIKDQTEPNLLPFIQDKLQLWQATFVIQLFDCINPFLPREILTAF